MKKLLKENRTLLILMCIAIACIIISSALLLKYFYFGNGDSKYGDRLDGIEKVEITNEKKDEIAQNIKQSELVEDASVIVTGKIVYERIIFNSNASLLEAQAIAIKSLESFSDEEKLFYDFEFTLKQEKSEKTEGFLIMGAKNVNGTNLVWNNNNPTTSKPESE